MDIAPSVEKAKASKAMKEEIHARRVFSPRPPAASRIFDCSNSTKPDLFRPTWAHYARRSDQGASKKLMDGFGFCDGRFGRIIGS
jgi:hypothetical protein